MQITDHPSAVRTGGAGLPYVIDRRNKKHEKAEGPKATFTIVGLYDDNGPDKGGKV